MHADWPQCNDCVCAFSARSNLISNMFKVYQTTGYVWEQYTDDLGMGKVGVAHGRGMCDIVMWQGSHMTAVAACGDADRSLHPDLAMRTADFPAHEH